MNEFISRLDSEFNIKLTDKQRAAVEHFRGPALVLSSAGSGKTTVNIAKCANLVIGHGIKPENILSLTYSKAAAIEMETRFKGLFGHLISESVKFCTIHAFSYRVIREYYWKNHRDIILIEGEKSPVKKNQILRDLNKNLFNTYITDDKLEELSGSISYCKNMMIQPSKAQELEDQITGFSEIYGQYEKIKEENNYMDFDDMLSRCHEALLKDSILLQKYRQQYHYIIVDEAQDTSKIQFEIISLIASPKNNLCLVGDDDQCIYSWRGAYPDYLLSFNKLYPKAAIFYLDENFRSTETIVSLSSRFIKNNKKRYNKNIITRNKAGEEIHIVKLRDDKEQVRYIVEELEREKDISGTAILYRNNISVIAVADALDRSGILFYIRDYDELFFKHWVKEDVLAFMRLARNPHDVSSFRRIYNKLGLYFNRASVEFMEAEESLKTVPEYLREYYAKETRRFAGINKLEFNLKNLALLDAEDAVEYINTEMGYGEYIEKNAEKIGYSPEGLMRVFKTLKGLATKSTSLVGFTERLSEIQQAIEQARYNKKKNACILSSIHSVKGMEFDNVYIIDLIDDQFPGKGAISSFEEGDESAMEEERRIAYVGITRAKHKLKLITLERKHDKKVTTSRFVTEIDKILKPSVVRESMVKANIGTNINTNTSTNISTRVTTHHSKDKHLSSNHVKFTETLNGITVGSRLLHRVFGEGTIVKLRDGGVAEVSFDNKEHGIKKMSLQICINNSIICLI